jgi:hypothetical protein
MCIQAEYMLAMTNLVEVGEEEDELYEGVRTQKTQEVVTVSPMMAVYGEKRLNSTGKGQNAKVTFQTSQMNNGEFLTHEEMRKNLSMTFA